MTPCVSRTRGPRKGLVDYFLYCLLPVIVITQLIRVHALLPFLIALGLCSIQLLALGVLHALQLNPTTPVSAPSFASSSPPGSLGYCWLVMVNILGHPSHVPGTPQFAAKEAFLARFDHLAVGSGFISHRNVSRFLLSCGYDRHARVFVRQTAPGYFHIQSWADEGFRSCQLLRLPAGLYGADGIELFYDTPLHSVALGPHLRRYLQMLATAVTQTPYQISRALYPLLDHFGMARPPALATAHRHGFHAALERRSCDLVCRLLTKLPNNAQGYGDYMTMFMRDDKVTALGLNPAMRYNPALTGKDLARYNLGLGPNRLAPATPPVWFAHDTLHFLNATIVGNWFDHHPELQTLICTAVIPVETLTGAVSRYPSLYQLYYHKDRVFYTPEHDSQATYDQPLMAHRWLTASTLITANRECLHVTLPMSTAAHHVFIISRQQISNDRVRFFDQSNLITIPWLAHPFGSPSDRETDPSLYQALFNYVYRNEKTGLYDINVKATAYKNEVDGKYPQSYIDAATIGVLYQKNFRLNSAPDKVHYTWFWISTLLGLPFIPFVWALHSFQTRTLALPFLHRVPFVECFPYSATARDDAELLRANDLCPAEAAFWWLPHNAGIWARVATLHALLGYFLLSKVVIFPIALLFVKLWPPFFAGLSYTLYNLDLTPERVAWGVVLIFLVLYFDLFPMGFAAGFDSLASSLPLRKSRHLLSTFVAILYGLPSSPYRSNNGHFVFTHALIGLQTWAFVAPRPLPHYLTPYPAFLHPEPRTAIAASLLFLALLEQTYLFFLLRTRPACTRPWHVVPTQPMPQAVVVPPGPAPPLPPVALQAPPPPQGPVPPVPPPVAAPIVAPFVMPAVVNGPPPPYQPNQFAAYATQPANVGNFTTWRNIMARLPPPNIPQFIAAQACVWDMLGNALGLLPMTVLGAYLSSIPAVAQQAPLLTGIVPGHQLPAVLAYFGVTAEVYPATDTVRGPTMRIGTVPLVSSVGQPGFPTLVSHVIDTGNGLHIAIGAPRVDPNIAAPNINLQLNLALSSTRVPLPSLASSLQIPQAQIFSEYYDRLMGWNVNIAAIAAGLVNSVRALPALVAPVYQPLVPLVVNHQLTPQDLVDARMLATDFKQHPQTLNARDLNVTRLCQSLSIGVKNPRTTPVELVLLHGSAGSGKSYHIKSQLAAWARDGPIRFHTWDPTLRPQLESEFLPVMQQLGLYTDDRTFCTGFVPFFQQTAGTLVLDDAGLLCAGYVPLLIATSFATTRLVFTYDSLQTRPPFPEAKALSRQATSTVDWLNAFDPTYATGNRRMSWEVCELFGLLRVITPGSQIHHGAVVIVSQVPRGVPIFVASPRFAETVAKSNTGFTSTFADSQGLSIDGDVALDLGGMTTACGDALCYTALTRCNGTIYLVLPTFASASGLMVSDRYGVSPILSAILAVAGRSQTPIVTAASDPDRLVARAIQAHMSNSLPPASRLALNLPAPQSFIAGQNVDRFNVQADPTVPFELNLPSFVHHTPALRNNIRQERRALDTTVQSQSRVVQARRDTVTDLLRHRALVTLDTTFPASRPPVPVPAARPVRAADPIVGHHPERFQVLREQYIPGHGLTNQLTLNGSPLGLTHSARDRATESMSLKARIQPRLAAITPDHRRHSSTLFGGLSKFMDVSSSPINVGLLETCVNDYLESWLHGRSQKDIRRAVDRAAVDWSPLVHKLFLKSQRVKKLLKANANASKGQIVTDVSHFKLFHDAVWALYVERSLVKRTRSNVYLHARKTIDQTKAWYARYWNVSSLVTYCDYTGWDSGVDESFSLLYARLYRAMGVPEPIIKRFVYERHNARTFLGPFPAMQASGDRYTWLNNTIGNMAITGASFTLKGDETAAFSGDDMILCGSAAFNYLPVNRNFVPKVVVANTGEFCGLVFGTSVLHVDPKTLLHRATIAAEDNRRDYDFWESVSYTLRFADAEGFYDDQNYAAVATLLARVYCEFSLPPSRFPVALVR